MKINLLKVLSLLSLNFTLTTACGETFYVDHHSTNPVPPFADWATAAVTIQDAIDVAGANDLVLVANGLYQRGGKVLYGATNRIAVTKPITVQSVNGPESTFIQGCTEPGQTVTNNGVRCAYLTNGAVLSGFTLTNGVATPDNNYGCGVRCESTNALVTNCVLSGNVIFASDYYYNASVVSDGTLTKCLLTGNAGGPVVANGILSECIISKNTNASYGGVVFFSDLNNCLIVRNHSSTGGPVYSSHANNCTIVFNSGGGLYYSFATNSIIYYNGFQNYWDGSWVPADSYNSFLASCCVGQSSSWNYGSHTITNEPGFVNVTNGNFQLRSNSFCLNVGSNELVTAATDLAGNPRIFGDKVDMGAYELQSEGLTYFQIWLQQNSLPIDGSADDADTDGDGMSNRQEWRFKTDPQNPLSAFRLAVSYSGTMSYTPYRAYFQMSWIGPAGTYAIERRSGLGTNSPFVTWGETTFADDGPHTIFDAVETNIFFYRVSLK